MISVQYQERKEGNVLYIRRRGFGSGSVNYMSYTIVEDSIDSPKKTNERLLLPDLYLIVV